MGMRSALAFIFTAAAAGVVAQPAPDVFPVLKEKQSLVAVVELAPGGPLQRVPDTPCKPARTDVPSQCVTIHFDPPPYWLQVSNIAVVFGPQTTPAQFAGATSSHYGMAKEYSGRYLAFFLTDGERYVFRRNARLPLVSKRDGTMLLPLWGKHAPFLPCAAADLKEEFQPDEVSPRLQEWAPDSAEAPEHPELFRRAGSGYVPRYAIAVDQLRRYLAQHPPAADGWDCRS